MPLHGAMDFLCHWFSICSKTKMAASSKKAQRGWENCSYCNNIFQSSDLEKHVQICNSSKAKIADEYVNHSFILGESLHSLATVRSIAEKGDELKFISTDQCENIVIVGFQLLKLLKICISDCVQITNSQNESEIQTVWPSKDRNITRISISKSLSDRLNITSEKITLTPFKGEKRPASHMTLEPLDGVHQDYFTDTGFLDCLALNINGRLVKRGSRISITFCGERTGLRVVNVDSDCTYGTIEKISRLSLSEPYFYISTDTRILFEKPNTQKVDKMSKGLRSVGGLSKEIEHVKTILDMTFGKSNLFGDKGMKTPKGILLFGPTGTGKTLLCRGLAEEMSCHHIFVNGPQVFSRSYGKPEEKLRTVFQEAKLKQPTLIIFNDIETFCLVRQKSNQEERRVKAALLTMLDSLEHHSVVVIATTNKPDLLDPDLRRPGRLDVEIEIGIPNPVARREILAVLLEDLPHDLKPEDLSTVASAAHGFVGADLTAVVSHAGMQAFKRGDDKPRLIFADFQMAMKAVKPSAIREILIDVPEVRWDDVCGQGELKLKLKQSVEWPLKHPEAFERMGISAPKGFLLYGPPGCSKTLIARALATESGLNFIAIKGPELFSKWVGESEKAVREVFSKARAASPSVVFFDEIDALAGQRGNSSGGTDVGDRVLTQLLVEIDGLQQLKDVIIVAATNRPDMIDKALLRPGRLDRIIYVPLPDQKTRESIFQLKFRSMPIDCDVNVEELVQATDGYSGAEVVAVCHESALLALQESLEATVVSHRHFVGALNLVKPRTSRSMVEFYDKYNTLQTNSGIK